MVRVKLEGAGWKPQRRPWRDVSAGHWGSVVQVGVVGPVCKRERRGRTEGYLEIVANGQLEAAGRQVDEINLASHRVTCSNAHLDVDRTRRVSRCRLRRTATGVAVAVGRTVLVQRQQVYRQVTTQEGSAPDRNHERHITKLIESRAVADYGGAERPATRGQGVQITCRETDRAPRQALTIARYPRGAI